MSEPAHAVVRDGAIDSVIVCDAQTAALFADLDVFPGCELVEVTDADPRPGIGWTRDGESWAPPPEPDPDPDPAPEPASEAAGDEPSA